MTREYKVETSVYDEDIEIKTTMIDHGEVSFISRKVIKTQEKHIHDALVSLGWTPPIKQKGDM